MPDAIQDSINKLDEAMAALSRAIDRAACAAEIEEKLRDYKRGGPWFYAPESEKQQRRRAIADEQDERAGEALGALLRRVTEDREILPAVLEEMKAPPTPLHAFMKAHDLAKPTPDQALLAELLDEQRRGRCERQLSEALPSAVLHAYDMALRASDATTVRYIEGAHRTEWQGKRVDKSSVSEEVFLREMSAIRKLKARIHEVREGRVEPKLRQWEDRLAAARKLAGRAAGPEFKVQIRQPREVA